MLTHHGHFKYVFTPSFSHAGAQNKLNRKKKKRKKIVRISNKHRKIF